MDVDPLLPKPRNERKTDPELDMENLSEIKHHMMTRNARAMDIDRRLQPNPTIRDTLEAIIKVFEIKIYFFDDNINYFYLICVVFVVLDLKNFNKI